MSEDTKVTAPSSDDIRDALAVRLLRMVQEGVKVKTEDADGRTQVEEIDPPAAYLSVIVAYLKTNPPATIPSASSATGVLKRHAGAVLPFAKTGTNKE